MSITSTSPFSLERARQAMVVLKDMQGRIQAFDFLIYFRLSSRSVWFKHIFYLHPRCVIFYREEEEFESWWFHRRNNVSHKYVDQMYERGITYWLGKEWGRFQDYHGQRNARLNRDQSVFEHDRKTRSSFFRIVSFIFFFWPHVYIQKIEKMWVDKMVHIGIWNHFFEGLQHDWKNSITPVSYPWYICS